MIGFDNCKTLYFKDNILVVRNITNTKAEISDDDANHKDCCTVFSYVIYLISTSYNSSSFLNSILQFKQT